VRNGQRLSIQVSYVGGQVVAPAIGNIIERDLKGVGIEIEQKTYPVSLYFAATGNGGIINTGKFQIGYWGWINGVDPDDSSLYLSTNTPDKGGQNDMYWVDPKVDAAEHDALTTFDIDRRKRDYSIIQHELVDQVPTIILFAERRVDVFSDHFKNYLPSPAETHAWNSWQWAME